MNRPEIIHEMNKFLLDIICVDRIYFVGSIMGIDNHNYTPFNQQFYMV